MLLPVSSFVVMSFFVSDGLQRNVVRHCCPQWRSRSRPHGGRGLMGWAAREASMRRMRMMMMMMMMMVGHFQISTLACVFQIVVYHYALLKL